MDTSRTCYIPLADLTSGKHAYNFHVGEAFFSEYEHSLVKKGQVDVRLELEKQAELLVLDFQIAGEIFVSCDVCLSDFSISIRKAEKQFVKFGGHGNQDDDEGEEIILLKKNARGMDVSSLIYEYINLSVPYLNRCEDGGKVCDGLMIKKLKELLAPKQELNNVDPRWDALKNVKATNYGTPKTKNV